ncbi:MAG: dephospho-CoA kinase [Myxococcales bacterium]|nr:dephospho-CoA kinase [Myxococcales bacterium]
MLRVGLTGGVGTGKSTVAGILREEGAVVIDADGLAREVVSRGRDELDQIVRVFGQGMLDSEGSLDRAALAARVFSDPSQRRALEAIVHPAVASLARERMADAEASGARWVVYDVPLLYENHLEAMFDVVIVVRANPENQARRLAARNGWTDAQVEERIRSQMPLEEKTRRADFVIDNDGDLAALRAATLEVVRSILEPRGGA